jgi:hypothetical protein
MSKINENFEIGNTGMPLGNIKTLETAEDLNNILIDGNYYCGGNNANLPLSGYSVYLEVKALNEHYILQRATRVTDGAPVIYERQHAASGWQPWKLVSVTGNPNIVPLYTRTVASVDDFKAYVKNNAPIGVGVYIVTIGSANCAIVHKTTASYATILWFGYASNLTQYILYGGTWRTVQFT